MNRHYASESERKPSGTSKATEQETLNALLLRTARGDREAFRAFYHQTSHRVYGLTRRTITDVDLSQKTTQEIYLQVWQEARTYDEASGSALAWLLAMAHRRAADNVRGRQFRSNRAARRGTETGQGVSDGTAGVSEAGMPAQTAQFLIGLSPIQRESICLAYYSCLTHREVAEHQSTPLATVKTRISSGLERLRTRLEET